MGNIQTSLTLGIQTRPPIPSGIGGLDTGGIGDIHILN